MSADDFSPENIAHTAFFTGHRIMPGKEFLLQAYEAGYRRFFCGCALGFDTLAAFQTVRLRQQYPGVVLSLAIPFSGQADGWHETEQKTYSRLLALADERIILSPTYYQGVMLARNHYMADRSSLCICYLTNMRGGTASTVRYALIHDSIRIVNLAVKNKSCFFRENTWNYMFISPSASENAVTAPLCLMSQRKMTVRRI